MATAKYLTEILNRIARIKVELSLIDSTQNRERIKSLTATGNIWPGMFGELSAVVRIAASDVELALEQIAEIERMERIVSVFENLDVDLSEDSLKALELLASEHRYRHEQSSVSDAINSAVAEVREGERDTEQLEAIKAIIAAGFSDPDAEDIWQRGNERITCETSYINEITTHSWTLERGGVTVDSGKSGEFRRLIEAIAPKVAEVKS